GASYFSYLLFTYVRLPYLRSDFQQLLLDQTNGLEVKLQGDPAVFELTEPIQQVSAGYHEQMSVGVRSSFHLASWSFSHHEPPKALSVLSTRTPSTCITASPHIAAEFSVCTEGGTLHLWSLETGLQPVRQEADTLCFRDDPYWRWSDFTSHPRVLTFADRTGVQFVDVRVPNSQGQDLFHIGQESSCRRGERVILPRCLRETNPVYCLVSTQFSLYIMDERFPLVPVAKWDHMLEGPPTYVGVIPGGVTDSSNKILLSTQHSQETLMVQYSSGHSGSCQLHLPAVCLPRISESLNHLAPLLPHHHDTVLRRLQSPLAGMAAASPQLAADRLLVFQLTGAGDLFFQRLSQKTADGSDDASGIRVESTMSNAILEEPYAEHPHQSMSETLSPSAGSNQQGSVALAPSCRPSCLLASNTGFCSWVHDLYRACTWKATISRPLCQISTLFPSNKISESSEEVAKLRQRLRDSMKWGALVPSLAAATSHRLEAVHPNGWKDPLSQRLTACWEGRLGLWWDDRLGRNKESKIQALREKRQRQKQLRSRSLSSLSRSFTASITSVEARSVWSCDSAPDGLASLPSTSQDCAADASQTTVTSRLSHISCAMTPSQSLQAKGIPCERRQTVRHYLSVGDGTSPGPAPSLPGSPPLSQRSQPPSKRSRMGF
ncbi:TATA box-binding protein-associated factor RNA polymerase I subunit C, partial [Eleutherodactylus coqui]|uniref:TATA box-binding protein-associated factor RNA polymerase I subunit C n=1 Tax=Eleutherodactylus coqui TaxID=57060 RepID=UPI00346323FA